MIYFLKIYAELDVISQKKFIFSKCLFSLRGISLILERIQKFASILVKSVSYTRK